MTIDHSAVRAAVGPAGWHGSAILETGAGRSVSDVDDIEFGMDSNDAYDGGGDTDSGYDGVVDRIGFSDAVEELIRAGYGTDYTADTDGTGDTVDGVIEQPFGPDDTDNPYVAG
jgi:hypothetical protein